MQAATVDKVRDAMGSAGDGGGLPEPARVGQEFQRAREQNPGIAMLLLSTSDGRAIAASSSVGVDPRRLAAMTNSLLTLGETVARELGMPSADHASIATPRGNMVLVRIQHDKPMTLAALGTLETNAALLLFSARDCASRIASLSSTR